MTGLNNFEVAGNYTLVITLGSVENAHASATANSDTVTIVNTNTQPAVTLGISQKTFTAGGETIVTASLPPNTTTNGQVVVNLSFTGTATPNLDYSVTGGFNQPILGAATDVIIIPFGQNSGSVVLTGLNDDLNRSETTVVVGIASVTNAVVAGTPTVMANYVNPNVPVTFSTENAVTAQGGVAAVQVFMSRTLPFQVSVNYTIANGTAFEGAEYLFPAGGSQGTLVFAPGTTVQTIYIDTIPLGPGLPSLPASTNFSVTLSGASLDVPRLGRSLGSGRHR